MPRPFLTARWTHLFLASYPVPPELLRPRLPPGLELDTLDGRCFVSLVAFQFLDTRVGGVSWPGYRHFAELNLRYYVRHQGERGVVFIREFVPQRLTAWAARTLYNEPYQAAPLTGVIREEATTIAAEYVLDWHGRRQTIAVTGGQPAILPAENSIEHFFKEHSCGFGVTKRGQTLRYEVSHPVWPVYPVRDYRIDLDWRGVYGNEWGVLENATPFSTVFAAGSAVSVYRGQPLPAVPERR